MTTLHSKFQLVFEDMRFLQNEFYRAAREKIDRDLPKNPDQNTDPLRERVTQLVDAFIDELFDQHLRHGVVVNGIDMGSVESLEAGMNQLDENIEPFDKELSSQLRDLYAKVDRATLEVSQLRKAVPKQAVEELGGAYKQNQRLIDEAFEDMSNKHRSAEDATGSQQLSGEDVDRAKKLQERYQNLKKRVESLKDAVPSISSDLDRLQDTTSFFQSGQGSV